MSYYTSYTTITNALPSGTPSGSDPVIYKFTLPGYSKDSVSLEILNQRLFVYILKNDTKRLCFKEVLPNCYSPSTKVEAHMSDGILKVYFHYENPVRKITIT